eukprot:1404251-Alexandrium_andersonii.AAC.1
MVTDQVYHLEAVGVDLPRVEEDLQPRRDEVYCISVPGARSQTASSTDGVGAEAGEGPEHRCAGSGSNADDCGGALGERD